MCVPQSEACDGVAPLIRLVCLSLSTCSCLPGADSPSLHCPRTFSCTGFICIISATNQLLTVLSGIEASLARDLWLIQPALSREPPAAPPPNADANYDPAHGRITSKARLQQVLAQRLARERIIIGASADQQASFRHLIQTQLIACWPAMQAAMQVRAGHQPFRLCTSLPFLREKYPHHHKIISFAACTWMPSIIYDRQRGPSRVEMMDIPLSTSPPPPLPTSSFWCSHLSSPGPAIHTGARTDAIC